MVTIFEQRNAEDIYENVCKKLYCSSGKELAEFINDNYDDITSLNIRHFQTFFGKTAWIITIRSNICIRTIDIREATEEEKKLSYNK